MRANDEVTTLKTLSSFTNEPFTNFQFKENHQQMIDALAKVKSQCGRNAPLHIGDQKIVTTEKITSVNPADIDQVIGTVSKATTQHIEQAMEVATKTFEKWKKVSAEERASYLFKAAERMRERKHEFSALLILESGKNWAEADADTAEAIDFLEYYGRQMLRLDRINEISPLPQIPTEESFLRYIPLGVGVIIPPWNFPLAICVGMTSAAVVAGNTVLLKPAENTPVIAHRFVELMEEVGLPPGVINFVPGDSSEIGDYLTSHPQTRFVSFTGSKEVGLHINELIAKRSPQQKWIKRIVAEMGGKGAVVVDETADLDLAAELIVVSAFGFQGQKCSAGSRAIIVEEVYDQVVEKVKARTSQLSIGLPEQNADLGPVIDQKAYEKIMGYIEIGKQEGKLIAGGQKAPGNGYFIQPTIFTDVKHEARILHEEIFGPVLAMTCAKDWKHAIDLYNDTEYGLTGSYVSQDEERIQYALEEMHCGNLYINRKCTGALVGVHPFGGFDLSGTDSKAGGHDYLLLFTQAKALSRAKTKGED